MILFHFFFLSEIYGTTLEENWEKGKKIMKINIMSMVQSRTLGNG